MAEASPVLGTPSSHTQVQQDQQINPNAAVVPGGPPPNTQSPFALMGRTRAQTTQLREGEGGAGPVEPTSSSTESRSLTAPETPTPSITGRKASRTAGVKKTSSTPSAALTVTAS